MVRYGLSYAASYCYPFPLEQQFFSYILGRDDQIQTVKQGAIRLTRIMRIGVMSIMTIGHVAVLTTVKTAFGANQEVSGANQIQERIRTRL